MNEHAQKPIDPAAVEHGHEIHETNTSLVVKFGIGLILMTVISMLLMWGMFVVLDDYQTAQFGTPGPLVETNQLPPEPRLQVIPEDDLIKMKAAEQEVLDTYGWVFRTADIVRLPVDRAIDLSLERKDQVFPTRPDAGSE